MHFCPEELSAILIAIQNWPLVGQFFNRVGLSLRATRRK